MEQILDQHDIQSLDAARLYYSGMSQAEVAERLHVARPTVSKLLQHAKKRGFVRVQIIDPREQDECIIETLTARYDLLELVLVSPAGSSPRAIRESLGHAGATLLKNLVRDGDTIGIVPSRTISAVSDAMEPTSRRGVTLVQVSNGLINGPSSSEFTRALHHLASTLSAGFTAVSAPSFLKSASQINQLMAIPHVNRVKQLADSSRIVLYTVGAIEDDLELIKSVPLSEHDRFALKHRAVGDICGRFVDCRGRVCLPDFNNRTLGITLPELRAKEQKVLVAGGDSKTAVILTALENGYVNRLVTDVETARKLVDARPASV